MSNQLKETAILVAVDFDDKDYLFEESIEELRSLSKTAGLDIKSVVVQKREKPNAAYFIGKGKLEEISDLLETEKVDCVIFENALTPSQQANLINLLNVKVLDRTGLIIDIFAQRAETKEGKLQVELAQMNYMLPRLKGKGIDLSRLGGGVGTRGPGETKLETDRRHIRKKIQKIEEELDKVKRHRETYSKQRKKNKIPLVSLVGYTNSGKSTLLNTLSSSNVLSEDKLFATLDPITRKIEFSPGKEILLTDTVGFINNLPHQLVNAFRATLEDIQNTDLILHIVDFSNENFEAQVKTVNKVLYDLNLEKKPVFYVFNKIDQLTIDFIEPQTNEKKCFVSAKTGENLDTLLEMLEDFFYKDVTVHIELPYKKNYLIDEVYSIGNVEKINYTNEYIEIELKTSESLLTNDLKKYSR